MKRLFLILGFLLFPIQAKADDVLAQVLYYGKVSHAGGFTLTLPARVLIVGAGNIIVKETEVVISLNLTSNQTTVAGVTTQVASQVKSLILAEYGHTVVRVLAPPLVSSTP